LNAPVRPRRFSYGPCGQRSKSAHLFRQLGFAGYVELAGLNRGCLLRLCTTQCGDVFTGHGGVYLSAYAGGGHQVIVVINSNTSAVTLPIQIRNQTVTSLTPWQTTSSASLSELSAITVSGNTLIAMLPAQSITTYVQ
jgi:hypothetical protein